MFDYSKTPRERRTLILASMLFWSVLSYMGMRSFVLEGGQVVGSSMYPTLEPGDVFVISRISYRLRAPRRGDIVALRLPGHNSLTVKRIVALPGERVQINGGNLFVNGDQLNEPYLSPRAYTEGGGIGYHEYMVAEDCYFVLGDNRPQSLDSRYFGVYRRANWLGYCFYGKQIVFVPLQRNHTPKSRTPEPQRRIVLR